jgi:hypothetical protein
MMKLLMMAIYILIFTNLSFAICPESNPGIRCIWYYDSCTSDLMCLEGQLCCLQEGCGHSCVSSI